MGEVDAAYRRLFQHKKLLRYLLAQEHELLKSAGLPGRNLAVLLFRLDRSRNLEQWRGLLHSLIQVVRE